jgi:hypothetical protein
MGTCPLSYFNGEGELSELAAGGPEALRRLASGGMRSPGLNSLSKELTRWWSSQPLDDFDVRVTQSVSRLRVQTLCFKQYISPLDQGAHTSFVLEPS